MKFGMKVKTKDMLDFERLKLENEEICLNEGIQIVNQQKKINKVKT